MCRACYGAFPTARDYQRLRNAAAAVRERFPSNHFSADSPGFIADITALDRMRFNSAHPESSPEWGHPETRQFTNPLLFQADPTSALTLFVLACWYDAQEYYTLVWTRRLGELAAWLTGTERSEDTLPSARSGDWTRAIAWKTYSRCQDGGFGRYFAETVTAIAAGNPSGKGNTWRFVARLALDLTKPGQATRDALNCLQAGIYRPLLYKRAWMLTMFLRRDQGIVRCLVERALSSEARGAEALSAWYDDRLFPSQESQLPVDQRMLAIGAELFRVKAPTPDSIMTKAYEWGQRHRLPPSSLDALFYAMD